MRSLIVATVLFAGPAMADGGLTILQKAQIADPNNPQFAPISQYVTQKTVDDTVYLFPTIPDEATKVWALKRAYQLNGNSMVGNNRMIDLTGETPLANPVKTEKVAAPAKNEADEQPDLNMNDLRKFSRRFNMKTDVCRQHKMHKVITGNSWKCRK